MIYRMKEIDRLLNVINLNELWEGFSKTKYALYDDENFYINDDEGLHLDVVKEDSCFVGKVDGRFMGNTAISVNNNFIAIWSEQSISKDMDDRKLTSLIIHEMFHCFQHQYGEKRFANELLGAEYPITIEHINLRTLEREALLNAVIESDKEKKLDLLATFFNIRRKREKLLGDMIEYEKAIESIEGTAVYVEFKSLIVLIKDCYSDVFQEYIKGFTDIDEKNLKIRHSTYNQGLLLCLIADEYITDWRTKYVESELYLSDFIKNEISIEKIDCEYGHENLTAIEQAVTSWEKQRDFVFSEFDRKHKINREEELIQIIGLDPMNIVKRNQEVIHKSFLRVKIGDHEQIIKGPVKTTIGDHLFDVRRIEW